jgi:hypothetical protein
MKRRALALALCAGLLLPGLMPGATLAIATPVYLDQSNTTYTSNVSGKLAQTFTAGQSGILSQVDLFLASLNSGGATLSVSIYPTDASGTPVTTGTALATSGIASVPYNASTGVWIEFSFASPCSVTAGTMYAIVFGPTRSRSIPGRRQTTGPFLAYCTGRSGPARGCLSPIEMRLHLTDAFGDGFMPNQGATGASSHAEQVRHGVRRGGRRPAPGPCDIRPRCCPRGYRCRE